MSSWNRQLSKIEEARNVNEVPAWGQFRTVQRSYQVELHTLTIMVSIIFGDHFTAVLLPWKLAFKANYTVKPLEFRKIL